MRLISAYNEEKIGIVELPLFFRGSSLYICEGD